MKQLTATHIAHNKGGTLADRIGDVGLSIGFAMVAIALLIDPYRYLYDDSFFYFQIASSLAEGQGPVFGAGELTNGYHPFWMFICASLAVIAPGQDEFVTLMAVSHIILNGATILILRLGLGGAISPVALQAGLLPALGYFLMAGYGMESPLVLLSLSVCLVCAVRFITQLSARWLIATAAAAGLCVFARLDAAIVLLPLAGYVLYHALTCREKKFSMPLLVAAVIGSLPTLAWLSVNLVLFGNPVPISGLLKLAGAEGFVGVSMSGVPAFMVIAMALSLVAIVAYGRSVEHRVILALGLGQLLYLGVLSASGQSEVYAWYFVPTVLTAGLCIAAAIDTVFTGSNTISIPHRRIAASPHRRIAASPHRELLSAALILLLATGGIGVAARYIVRQGIDVTDYRGPESLGAKAESRGINRVVAFDRPGQLAFLDGLTVIAADGLTTSLKFQERLRDKGLDWLIEHFYIQAFVGPSESGQWLGLCDGRIYLGSTQYSCNSEGKFTDVTFFSRLDGSKIGTLDISTAERIDFFPKRELALYDLSNHARSSE